MHAPLQSGDVGGVYGMEALHAMCKTVWQLWARKGDGSNFGVIHWIIFFYFKATWWNRNHSRLWSDVTKPQVIWCRGSEFLKQDVLLLHDNAMPHNGTHHHKPAEHFALETRTSPTRKRRLLDPHYGLLPTHHLVSQFWSCPLEVDQLTSKAHLRPIFCSILPNLQCQTSLHS